MRSSLKSVLLCSALLATAGLAAAQNTDPKKPAAPSTAPTKPATPAAQPSKDAKPAAPAGAEGMDPKMLALMSPGPEHKKLEPMVGTFDAVCKFTMGPGQEAISKGVAVNKWVLDGHFVETTFNGSMNDQAFRGTGFMGYNNMSKQFESYWIDSMSTGMMMSTGAVSADGKTFNWSGECDDPMAGKRVKMRSVNKITDTGYIMEMYSPGPDGKEMKNGEITFTRTGAAKPETKPAAAPTPKK